MTHSVRYSIQKENPPIPVLTEDGFKVLLTRYPLSSSGKARPLLLMHGASAWSNTFQIRPDRVQSNGKRLSVVEFLNDAGYDVWLLDWRGGGRPEIVAQVHKFPPKSFTIDEVARHDIPKALAKISEVTGSQRVDVIAHCMGAGSLAFGLGRSDLRTPILKYLGNVVLCTLGLFYEAPWDGLAKVQDHLLDVILATDPNCPGVSPDVNSKRPWPEILEFAFSKWPASWQPTCSSAFCHRLAFMFGSPYCEDRLSEGIHNHLEHFFGPIPIAHYAHAAQNTLRGYAAPFNVEGQSKPAFEACLDLEGFEELHAKDLRIGLVTGSRNILWHRESIDRMHDWLRRRLPAQKCQKRIIPDYGHQDLFWGKDAADNVFPVLLELLSGENARNSRR